MKLLAAPDALDAKLELTGQVVVDREPPIRVASVRVYLPVVSRVTIVDRVRWESGSTADDGWV